MRTEKTSVLLVSTAWPEPAVMQQRFTITAHHLGAARSRRSATVDRGSTGYFARDVLDLIAGAERRLASTRFDTSFAPQQTAGSASPRLTVHHASGLPRQLG